MIEVEKGFNLTEEQERALIDGAEFLGEKKFTDVYYDDTQYSLTLSDHWLRKRDGRFELKVSMNKPLEERISDQYEELESDEAILQYFKAEAGKTMASFLEEKNYKPFCTVVTTTRRKYRKEGFNIDLDAMDFGYACAEIELMIEDASSMEEATQSIIQFAAKHGITEGNKWGKVIEYVKRNNPAHFQAFIDAGIIY